MQLKEMVDDGLVTKTIYPELPPRSLYAISPLGMSLIPIIDAMLQWGQEHQQLFEKKIWLATAAITPTWVAVVHLIARSFFNRI